MNTLVNIICTDEVFLQQQACDQIIRMAKEKGVTERKIVDVVDKFNWDDLLADSCSLSLFSERKLTDIRFAKSAKKDAQQALVELIENADQENQFLIRLPKLEKRQKNTKWFKSISKNSRVQELWAPKAYEFQAWILQRAKYFEINLEADAVAMIAEQTEGNLLAANQTLEKLKLIFSEQTIDCEMLKDIISDNARYSIFLCLDEALSGQGIRAVKMLKKFKQESLAPISILVNLSREISLCNQVSIAVSSGQPAMQPLSKTFLWDSKKRLIVSASARLPLIIWQKLVARCAYLDRMIKGQEQGNIWQELEACLWMLSGKRIWAAKKH